MQSVASLLLWQIQHSQNDFIYQFFCALQHVLRSRVCMVVGFLQMVFCFKNCSSDWEKLLENCKSFEEFPFEITMEGQNNFWKLWKSQYIVKFAEANLWSKFCPTKILHSSNTVQSQTVYRATIQFGPLWPKVTVHKHQIFPF